MNTVKVQDANGKPSLLLLRLQKILLKSMSKMNLRNVEVDVTLVPDRVMKTLNKKYRGKNKSTDVLSFSQKDMVVKGRKILGDIIIAKETTKKQARAAGHTIRDEYAMLAIHGLLHLLDYDHEEIKDEVIMFRLQNKLLHHVQNL